MTVNSLTKPVYIIGNPVKHSKSPVFQNAAFEYSNLNLIYLALNVEQDNFDCLINGLKSTEIAGLNITVPYKLDIIKHANSLSKEAAIIGAVNCIEVLNNRWIGHNTDWYGVLKTLEINSINKKSKTLVYGAGGATAGVIYGLKQYGIDDITITNRTISKAHETANKFNIKTILSDEICNEKFDFYINTTTVDFDFLIKDFNYQSVYFDLKYYNKPINHHKFIDGKLMLLYQGAMSFEIWSKQTAPLEIMKNALFENKTNL